MSTPRPDPDPYAEEAEQRWGDTEAYRQSQARSRTYTEEDWARIKAEADNLTTRMADAYRSGVPASAPQAKALSEEHREHLTRWFYDCPPEMHAKLGEMYVADPRFTATYDAVQPGLAVWIRDAFAV